MSDESNKRKRLGQDSSQPFEDRALKAAMQLFGNELLPVMGVKEAVRRIAPTEQIHLEVKSLMEDFNFEMEDGTWRHFEFESDSITDEDLRRFRAYEAMIGFYYGVEVETYVICTALAKKLKKKLKTGRNVYRVKVIRMKDRDADQVWEELCQKKEHGGLERSDLIHLLLTPLMSGETSIANRIEQGIRMLQKEQELIGKEDLMRMEAILYTFAVKFVTGTELKHIQEVVKMTLLGQMLVDSGRQEGIQALIETCQEFGNPKDEVREKLTLKFSLTKEKAEEYLKQYWK
ncbi:MAG: hypothetical protein Q4F28_14980 [Eubacteriales bacterium]|nr:hypothetical protein [Eubacteriales bacterium]